MGIQNEKLYYQLTYEEKKALRNEMNLEKWCQHRDMWGKTQDMYIWRNSDITEFNLTVTKGE